MIHIIYNSKETTCSNPTSQLQLNPMSTCNGGDKDQCEENEGLQRLGHRLARPGIPLKLEGLLLQCPLCENNSSRLDCSHLYAFTHISCEEKGAAFCGSSNHWDKDTPVGLIIDFCHRFALLIGPKMSIFSGKNKNTFLINHNFQTILLLSQFCPPDRWLSTGGRWCDSTLSGSASLKIEAPKNASLNWL